MSERDKPAYLITARDPKFPPGEHELHRLYQKVQDMGPFAVIATTACVDIYQCIDGVWEHIGPPIDGDVEATQQRLERIEALLEETIHLKTMTAEDYTADLERRRDLSRSRQAGMQNLEPVELSAEARARFEAMSQRLERIEALLDRMSKPLFVVNHEPIELSDEAKARFEADLQRQMANGPAGSIRISDNGMTFVPAPYTNLPSYLSPADTHAGFKLDPARGACPCCQASLEVVLLEHHFFNENKVALCVRCSNRECRSCVATKLPLECNPWDRLEALIEHLADFPPGDTDVLRNIRDVMVTLETVEPSGMADPRSRLIAEVRPTRKLVYLEGGPANKKVIGVDFIKERPCWSSLMADGTWYYRTTRRTPEGREIWVPVKPGSSSVKSGGSPEDYKAFAAGFPPGDQDVLRNICDVLVTLEEPVNYCELDTAFRAGLPVPDDGLDDASELCGTYGYWSGDDGKIAKLEGGPFDGKIVCMTQGKATSKIFPLEDGGGVVYHKTNRRTPCGREIWSAGIEQGEMSPPYKLANEMTRDEARALAGRMCRDNGYIGREVKGDPEPIPLLPRVALDDSPIPFERMIDQAMRAAGADPVFGGRKSDPLAMTCPECLGPAALVVSEHRHFDRDDIYYGIQCRKCGETEMSGTTADPDPDPEPAEPPATKGYRYGGML